MHKSVTLTAEQVEIGLEAAWEIEALTELMLQAVQLLPETAEEHLAYRGVALRTRQLSSVLMTLLGDDLGRRDVVDLTHTVLGVAEVKLRYPDR